MCGITGFSGTKNKKLLSSLLRDINHRGRDEVITKHYPSFNLGMVRLSINDLNAAHYPFEHENLALIFNGEIYNYSQLKKSLTNYNFKTSCDAEVILPLVKKFGIKEAIEKLDGMFAICIFNKKTKQLFLSRDYFGEKPLYYTFKHQDIFFSSELEPLLKISARKINKKQLANYFYHGSSQAGNTLVKGIYKVPQRSILTFEKGKPIDIYLYKKMSSKVVYKKNKVDQLDLLIKKSVESRLLSDVPLGVFLSGGVDSSLITYHASQKINNLHTFSISFPNFKRENESNYSRKVAKLLQTNHTEVECTSETALEAIKKIDEIIDEPIVDPAFIPTYILAKEARKKVKVILSGEGADELFMGYHRYTKQKVLSLIRTILHPNQQIHDFRDKYFPHRFERLFLNIESMYSPQRVWTYNSNIVNNERPTSIWAATGEFTQSMQISDINSYLSEQLLMKVDKATMANNLEARAPFLNFDIAEFGLNLSLNDKFKYGQSKYILKRVATKYLPLDVVWRMKHGFSVPLHTWFRKDLKETLNDSLQLYYQSDLFNKALIKKTYDDHIEKKNNNASKLWSLLVLSKWLKRNDIEA